jgi:hypothetical protein
VKMMWCWECEMEVPMFDEEEFAFFEEEYKKAIAISPEERATALNRSSAQALFDSWYSLGERRFRRMLEEHERRTGMFIGDPQAILHHRISLYGGACPHCGKTLRRPESRVCEACSYQVPERG